MNMKLVGLMDLGISLDEEKNIMRFTRFIITTILSGIAIVSKHIIA